MKEKGRELVIKYLITSGVLFGIAEIVLHYYAVDVGPYVVLMMCFAVAAIVIAEEIARPEFKEYLRSAALYPKVPDSLLQKEPQPNSVVFGRDIHSNSYVMKDPKEIQHTMIIGQTGSGKTASILLPTIYSCTSGSKMVLDIKSRELVLKSADLTSEKTYVVDLNRHDAYCWGWNVFYKLNQNSTEYEVLNVLQEIASILLPDPKTGDQFWSQAARNLFIGLGIYEYLHQGKHNFVDMMGTMLSIPLRDHLEKALNTVKKDSLTASFLNAYKDTADETLMSIQITMTQPLYIFLQEDVQHTFKKSTHMATPMLLNEEGTSIYLNVDENKLDTGYDRLVQIILKQTLLEIQSRSSLYDGPITNLIWDEYGRCCDSCPDMLKATASFLKTARSKKANLTMAVQSMDSFDKTLLYDLLSNITYILVLNCSNSNSLTAEVTVKLAGKYYEQRKSFNTGRNKNSSISFEEKDVLKPSDLNVLGDQAVLLVSNLGYFRTDKSKTAYWKYEPFKSQYETIYNNNKNILTEV